MVRRPGFLTRCEHWRDCPIKYVNEFHDVYDENVWKDLHRINQRPFLAIQNNLCLGMNID